MTEYSGYSVYFTNLHAEQGIEHSFDSEKAGYYLALQRDPVIGLQTKRCFFRDGGDQWEMVSSLPLSVDIPKSAALDIAWDEVSDDQAQGNALWKYSAGFLPALLDVSKDYELVDRIIETLWRYTQSSEWAKRSEWMTSLDHSLATRLRTITTLQAQYEQNGKSLPNAAHLIVANDVANIMEAGDSYFPLNNHGAMVAISLLHVGAVFPGLEKLVTGPPKLSILQAGWDRLWSIINALFDEYGVAGENSPEYQRYWISLLTPVTEFLEKWNIDLARSEEESDEPASLAELLSRAKEVLHAFTDDSGRLIAIGDSHPRVLKDARVKSTRLFSPRQGFAVFREGATHVTFNCGSTNYAHKHCDDTSITVTRHGERLILDSGYYSHDWNDPKAIYTKSQNAHSGVFLRKLDNLHPGNLYWPNKERVVGKMARMDTEAFHLEGTVSIDEVTKVRRELEIPHKNLIRLADSVHGEFEVGGEAVRRFIFPIGMRMLIGNNSLMLEGKKTRLEIIVEDVRWLRKVRVSVASVSPYFGWISEEIKDLTPAYCVEIPISYNRTDVTSIVLSDV